ncbi:MAG: amidohydrolase family protein [Planctomycetota bacterium]
MKKRKKILRFKKLLIQPGLFLDDAYIIVENNYVSEVGRFTKALLKIHSGQLVENYDYVATSGFVNAHTHLVFSNIPTVNTFRSFLDFVKYLNKNTSHWSRQDYVRSYLKGIELVQNSNSTFIIDFVPAHIYPVIKNMKVINIISAPEFIVSEGTFVKDTLRKVKKYPVIAFHSLYSVHKNFIENVAKRLPTALVTLHFAEFKEENIFLKTKKGLIGDLFNLFRRSLDDFLIPGKNSTDYLLTLPVKNNKLLLVHSNYLTKKDITKLSKLDCVFVKCPRSSLSLGNDISNIEILLQNNCRIALGTDSLASCPCLDVLEEAKFLRRHFKINLSDLWKMLTGYYLNNFFNTYSFGYVMTGKKLLLNLYDIEVNSFEELLECLFNVDTNPAGRIIT